MKKGCLGDCGALESLDWRESLSSMIWFNCNVASFPDLFIFITIYEYDPCNTHLTLSHVLEIKTAQHIRQKEHYPRFVNASVLGNLLLTDYLI